LPCDALLLNGVADAALVVMRVVNIERLPHDSADVY
jgi:hypothetical protein